MGAVYRGAAVGNAGAQCRFLERLVVGQRDDELIQERQLVLLAVDHGGAPVVGVLDHAEELVGYVLGEHERAGTYLVLPARDAAVFEHLRRSDKAGAAQAERRVQDEVELHKLDDHVVALGVDVGVLVGQQARALGAGRPVAQVGGEILGGKLAGIHPGALRLGRCPVDPLLDRPGDLVLVHFPAFDQVALDVLHRDGADQLEVPLAAAARTEGIEVADHRRLLDQLVVPGTTTLAVRGIGRTRLVAPARCQGKGPAIDRTTVRHRGRGRRLFLASGESEARRHQHGDESEYKKLSHVSSYKAFVCELVAPLNLRIIGARINYPGSTT